MALIRGRSLRTRRQVVEFLLRDLHLTLAPEVVEWFNYIKNLFPKSELKAKSIDLIDKAVKKEFHRQAGWNNGEWYNPGIPYIKLVSSGLPYFDFSIDLYLVASIDVAWEDKINWYSDECVLIEPIKKDIEKFQMPLDFLKAIAEGDLSQFEKRKIEVGTGYSTWHVPSLNKEIRLHDTFLRSLHDTFHGKPLGPALTYYGLASMRDSYLSEQKLLRAPPLALKASREDTLSEAETSKKREEVKEALTGKTLRLGTREAEAILSAKFDPALSVAENVKLCLESLQQGRP